MTRPLTEDSPGKQQANYGYRIRQLERRPAPDRAFSPKWAYIRGSGGNDVPTDTWADLISTGETYYEGFESENDNFTVDLNSGYITGLQPGLYYVTAFVEATPSGLADGDTFAVALNRGASGSFASYRITSSRYEYSDTRDDTHVVTTAHWGENSSWKIEVWHNGVSDQYVADWQLFAVLLNPFDKFNLGPDSVEYP